MSPLTTELWFVVWFSSCTVKTPLAIMQRFPSKSLLSKLLLAPRIVHRCVPWIPIIFNVIRWLLWYLLYTLFQASTRNQIQERCWFWEEGDGRVLCFQGLIPTAPFYFYTSVSRAIAVLSQSMSISKWNAWLSSINLSGREPVHVPVICWHSNCIHVFTAS